MDTETMEYALNQNVIFETEIRTLTGKITGHFGDKFIITLDSPLSGGETTILLPHDSVRPLTCHWCQDAQKVPAGSFTVGEAEAGCIPQIDCPYCTKN